MRKDFPQDGTEQPPATLEEEVRGLKDLLSVAQVVVSSLDLDEVLPNILGSAMTIMNMPAGSIALYDADLQRFTLHAHAGLSPSFIARTQWELRAGGLTDHILQEGDFFVVEDTSQGPFADFPLFTEERIGAIIAAPLRIQREIVGILFLDDFGPRHFSPQRLRFLAILASFATMSIDNARLHERTQRLACTDGLTGLYNYRQFKKMFREEMARTQRHEKNMSLTMFDIDDFKRFNDLFGHPCGDRALVAVAEIMRDSLRECDHLFRYGGEEFIAILPETDFGEALIAAERTREAVEQTFSQRFADAEAATRGLTVSVGVATYPRDGRDLEHLLKVVDDLLYMAKRCGKNKVYSIPPPPPPEEASPPPEGSFDSYR